MTSGGTHSESSRRLDRRTLIGSAIGIAGGSTLAACTRGGPTPAGKDGDGDPPWIDIRSHGATGNGTDETSAIQAAYDAAQQAGAWLYLSPGTYMGQNIALKASTFGPGTLKLPKGASKPLLIVPATGDFRLEGITLDGNKANQTVSPADNDSGEGTVSLLALNGSAGDLFCTRVTFQNARQSSVWSAYDGVDVAGIEWVAPTGRFHFHHCTFQDSHHIAIRVNGKRVLNTAAFQSRVIDVRHCTFRNIDSTIGDDEYGGCLYGAEQFDTVFFENNSVADCNRTAVKIGMVLHSRLRFNTIYRQKWECFQVKSHSPGSTHVDYPAETIIEYNTAYDCGRQGPGFAQVTDYPGGTSGETLDYTMNLLRISHNVIVESASRANTAAPDTILVHPRHRYQNVDVSGNVIVGAKRRNMIYFINGHYGDPGEGACKQVTIQNNVIEVEGRDQGGALIRIEHVGTPDLTKRWEDVYIKGNVLKSTGSVVPDDHAIWFTGNAAKRYHIRKNDFPLWSQPPLIWATSAFTVDTQAPEGVYIEDNDFTGCTVTTLTTMAGISNIWWGPNNVAAAGKVPGQFASTIGNWNQLAAPPAAGYWHRGTVIWNISPTAGGTLGWVCTASGAPGTWKEMAAVVV